MDEINKESNESNDMLTEKLLVIQIAAVGEKQSDKSPGLRVDKLSIKEEEVEEDLEEEEEKE